jgi:hypothetical protein
MMVLFVAVFVLFPVSRVVWILFQIKISKICIECATKIAS